jgi:hypothetical protein
VCNYKVISFLNSQAIAASNFTIKTYLFLNIYFLFNFESVTRTTSIYKFASYYNLQDNSCELQTAKFLKFDNVSFTLRQFNYKWLKRGLAAFTKTFLPYWVVSKTLFLNKDYCRIFVSNYLVISSEAYSLWELLISTELEFSFPYLQWLAIGSY